MLAPRPSPTAPRSREPGDASAVWDLHGPAMLTLATAILQDAAVAEAVVERAVLDACSSADDWGAMGRRQLTRYVYVLCLQQSAVPASSTRELGLGRLSASQRTAVALGLVGDHTYRDVAALMGLGPADVADLMRSGLRRVLSGLPEG